MIHYGLKAIFIHIPRTAGNSITYALRSFPSYECSGHTKHQDIAYYRRMHPAEFGQFFRFSCVRNPFEKVLSHYEFKRISQDKECVENSFAEWIRKYHKNDSTGVIFKPQVDFLSIGGEGAVDFIMRYERLEEDFAVVCSRLKIVVPLAHLFPTSAKRYQDHYDGATREIVETIFRKDMEAFGYGY